MKNTKTEYGSVAKWLHWVAALLIIGMLIYGTVMSFVDSKALRSTLIGIHKSIGLVILTLIIVRWIWRRINESPDLSMKLSAHHQKLVHILHEVFYLVIFIMLLSGILMTASHHYPIPFFGLFDITLNWFPKSKPLAEFFNWTHFIVAWLLALMLTAHVLAALFHHFRHKDDTLKRMLPKKLK